MAAPDTAKIQVNLKTPKGALINIYAENEVEASSLLDDLQALAPRIIEVETLFNAVAHAAPITQPAAAAPRATATSSATPQCDHGAMEQRTGVSAKGPWTGWFCPAPPRTPGRCKTRFVD